MQRNSVPSGPLFLIQIHHVKFQVDSAKKVGVGSFRWFFGLCLSGREVEQRVHLLDFLTHLIF